MFAMSSAGSRLTRSPSGVSREEPDGISRALRLSVVGVYWSSERDDRGRGTEEFLADVTWQLRALKADWKEKKLK
jgi:hypothetical protein